MSRYDDGPGAGVVITGILLIVIVIGTIIGFAACTTRIDAGHVGIEVRLAGTDRGVQDIPIVTGWVFYNPLSEQVVEFPISIQNAVWTKSATEGSANDDSITFSSSEGVVVNADIGLAFRIDPKQAPHIYLKFREPNLQTLAHGYIRNAVREAFSVVASKLPVQEVYGPGKTKMVMDVVAELNKKLGPDGFIIDQLTINGALRLPENVATAINQAMEATQRAMQAENKVRQIKAEAEQAVAKATGEAEAARSAARGNADAVLINARAEAKANMIIRLSTTGAVLQYRALEKWNGKLPVFSGGDKMPMLTFDSSVALGADADKKLAALLAEEEKVADKKDEKAAAKKVEDTPKPAAPPPAAPAPAASK